MRLRKYIPRGGEASWKGPSTFKRAKLYGFVTKADPAAVHDLLARNIWRPSRALGLPLDVSGTTLDRVLFLFIDSERHQPSLKGAPETAGIQVEQLFAVIVLGRRTWPSPTFVLFAPYVFASETPGWRAEREIYGYPQQFGRIEVSRAVGGGEPNAFSVSSRTIAAVRREWHGGRTQVPPRRKGGREQARRRQPNSLFLSRRWRDNLPRPWASRRFKPFPRMPR